MSFRRPVSTMGGHVFWRLVKQSDLLLMQEHVGVWFYRYRILLRENGFAIARARGREEIEADWNFVTTNAVPYLREAIDLGKTLRDIATELGGTLARTRDILLEEKTARELFGALVKVVRPDLLVG